MFFGKRSPLAPLALWPLLTRTLTLESNHARAAIRVYFCAEVDPYPMRTTQSWS
jgi:hypothetical protein